jgi:hypothetical protein
MSERSLSWTSGFWLLVCAGLAGIIMLELSSSLTLAPQVTAAPPLAPPAQARPDAPLFEAPPENAFEEIALRPLFYESRRPYVPPAEDAEAAPAEPEAAVAVELVGTLVTDQGRAALVQPAGQEASWRREGDKIAGWRIGAIERDSITLRQGDETETLTLRADLASPGKPQKGETAADRRKRKKQQQQQQAVANDPTHN